MYSEGNTVNPYYRGSSQKRAQIQVSCITGRFFTIRATREAHTFNTYIISLYGAMLWLDRLGDRFKMYRNTKSVCCITGTNIVLKINCTSKSTNKQQKKTKKKTSDLWLPGQGGLLQREVDGGS